jgi:hypothetical protein
MGTLIHSDYVLTLDPGHKAYQDRFNEGFGNVEPLYPNLFKVRTSDKPDETVVAHSDVPEPELRTPGSAPSKESVIIEQWRKTLTHAEYAMFAKIDEGTWEDFPADMRGSYPLLYGRAMNSKAEALAAAVISGGFATVGPDGKMVFAEDHPLQTGGTWSNKATTALGAGALATVRAAMRTQLSPFGRVMSTPMGKYLVVPPALEKEAYELTSARMYGLEGKSGGTNFNDANFLSQIGLMPLAWNYLTVSTTDWYVFIDPAEMVRGFEFYWRLAPTYRGGIDEENTRYWLNARMRCSVGAIDARAAFGNDV